METTFEIELLGPWQNDIHPFFWISFGCSLNHILKTLVPSDQFLDQLKIRDYNPINRLSVIYYRDHHSRLIV
jgi:hypothetical protein